MITGSKNLKITEGIIELLENIEHLPLLDQIKVEAVCMEVLRALMAESERRIDLAEGGLG